jgi:hypothetical protein
LCPYIETHSRAIFNGNGYDPTWPAKAGGVVENKRPTDVEHMYTMSKQSDVLGPEASLAVYLATQALDRQNHTQEVIEYKRSTDDESPPPPPCTPCACVKYNIHREVCKIKSCGLVRFRVK